jgi:hypothetical protein
LLEDDEVENPSSSKPKQAQKTIIQIASRKGKERAHPAPESEAASISDEIATDAEDQVETEEQIMEGQVALITTCTPPQ